MKWNQNEMDSRLIRAIHAISCHFDSDHLIPNSMGEREKKIQRLHLSLVHKPITMRIWLGFFVCRILFISIVAFFDAMQLMFDLIREIRLCNSRSIDLSFPYFCNSLVIGD